MEEAEKAFAQARALDRECARTGQLLRMQVCAPCLSLRNSCVRIPDGAHRLSHPAFPAAELWFPCLRIPRWGRLGRAI